MLMSKWANELLLLIHQRKLKKLKVWNDMPSGKSLALIIIKSCLALIIKKSRPVSKVGYPSHPRCLNMCIYIKKIIFHTKKICNIKFLGVYLVQGKLVYVWFKASTGKYSKSTEHVLLMGHLINEPTHIKYV